MPTCVAILLVLFCSSIGYTRPVVQQQNEKQGLATELYTKLSSVQAKNCNDTAVKQCPVFTEGDFFRLLSRSPEVITVLKAKRGYNDATRMNVITAIRKASMKNASQNDMIVAKQEVGLLFKAEDPEKLARRLLYVDTMSAEALGLKYHDFTKLNFNKPLSPKALTGKWKQYWKLMNELIAKMTKEDVSERGGGGGGSKDKDGSGGGGGVNLPSTSSGSVSIAYCMEQAKSSNPFKDAGGGAVDPSPVDFEGDNGGGYGGPTDAPKSNYDKAMDRVASDNNGEHDCYAFNPKGGQVSNPGEIHTDENFNYSSLNKGDELTKTMPFLSDDSTTLVLYHIDGWNEHDNTYDVSITSLSLSKGTDEMIVTNLGPISYTPDELKNKCDLSAWGYCSYSPSKNSGTSSTPPDTTGGGSTEFNPDAVGGGQCGNDYGVAVLACLGLFKEDIGDDEGCPGDLTEGQKTMATPVNPDSSQFGGACGHGGGGVDSVQFIYLWDPKPEDMLMLKDAISNYGATSQPAQAIKTKLFGPDDLN